VEEPDLRQHQRDRRQRDRDGSAPATTSGTQPDEVLRREDLREGQEAGHRGGEGERQPGTHLAEARVQEPDRRDGEGLEHKQHRATASAVAAGQVAPGDARRLDDVRVVETEPVEHEQQGGAETLDLQAARGLRVEALVDAVRGVGRERRHDRGGNEHQHSERERVRPRPARRQTNQAASGTSTSG
jgi:hypothetical protein